RTLDEHSQVGRRDLGGVVEVGQSYRVVPQAGIRRAAVDVDVLPRGAEFNGFVRVSDGLLVFPQAKVGTGPIHPDGRIGWVQSDRCGRVGNTFVVLLLNEVQIAPHVEGPKGLRIQLEGRIDIGASID